MSGRASTARALANVALVKYFGKRDATLNLPASGSLSLALEPLATVTTVSFDRALTADQVELAGVPADPAFAGRVSRFLDLVRELADVRDRAHVSTRNEFPTAAGLASSAAGFAALALAATSAAGLVLDRDRLSALARRGSGSAARSVPGGVAVWEAGRAPDGSDSFARQFARPDELPLGLVVGVAASGAKPIGSTAAMERVRQTSPYYAAWIDSNGPDLAGAIEAIDSRDWERLGEITERSALGMHAAALAARPAIVYWNSATISGLHRVRELRAAGHAVWFTCDAGPQPKALCLATEEDAVADAFAELPGIERVIRCRIGGGAVLVDQS